MYLAYLAISFIFATSLTLASTLKKERLLVTVLCLSVTMFAIFYFMAMWRTAGVDFENYVQYHKDPALIPDIGYTVIARAAASLGAGFTTFLVLQATFTVYCIYRLSKRLEASFLISFGIFVAHSAIVRDLSQSRVGLAVAIVFLAYAQRSRLPKYMLLVAACTVHLSVVSCVAAFVLVDYLATWRRNSLLAALFLSGALALILGENILQLLSFIDPRIELYLKWDEELYGAPVRDYSQLLFYLLLLIISSCAYLGTRQELFLKFSILTYFAVLLFVAFSELAIFAYRVSHLLTIFYPFVFSKILSYRWLPARVDQKPGTRIDASSIKILSVAISLAILLISARPSNGDVLNEIVSKLHF